ncbi:MULTISPECIES: nuclear transport factor 2 family protein [Paenibacillus]|uniref:nuclear transport factor 2 family protein n=1 Tax=Paenibacillus TaxID=44249 RepID=UPI0022B8E7ED|nr:nuclear transport factor 2 family protein [Paenibacillus caseinilyticus]MCZ8518209.1 nuclear transport factor 2 family protein [Paenibacillus caseinilyticus]
MQSAQQVLTSYFQALGSKQIDKVIELVHDEANFVILKKETSDKIPLYGTYHGKEGVRTYLKLLEESEQIERFVLHKLIGNQEAACAWGNFRIKVHITGKVFESDWAIICEVEQEKIKFFQIFEDTAALEEAFDVSNR